MVTNNYVLFILYGSLTRFTVSIEAEGYIMIILIYYSISIHTC